MEVCGVVTHAPWLKIFVFLDWMFGTAFTNVSESFSIIARLLSPLPLDERALVDSRLPYIIAEQLKIS